MVRGCEMHPLFLGGYMGIVGKIWNVSRAGNSKKSESGVKAAVDYILNEEKCDFVMDSNLKNELIYITDEVKTLKGAYVGCRHLIDAKSATDEMMAVKRFYNKEEGRAIVHGIISVDAIESDPANAPRLMLLCDEFLKMTFPNHQAVFAIHLNTDNMHVHFVVNTVGLDGSKVHMDNRFIKEVFQKNLNKLARKYGFSENEKWKKKNENKDDIVKIKIRIRQAIDKAIEESDSMEQFLESLKDAGYQVYMGKYLSLKDEEMNKALRSYRLGSNYNVESIIRRIKEKRLALEKVSSESETKSYEVQESAYMHLERLKPFKELSEKQKDDAIKKLKRGSNPWSERFYDNKYLEKMKVELDEAYLVKAIVKTYSLDVSNPKLALENISKLQKEFKREKKLIQANMKRYASLYDIYKELQKCARGAYLFETMDDASFVHEYQKYKELEDRLAKYYSKDVSEVAAFFREQENELVYVNAALKELNQCYMKVYSYHKENDLYKSLYASIGHSDSKENAFLYGLYETEYKCIVAKGNEDYYIVLERHSETIDKKAVVVTNVIVKDKDANEIERICSKDFKAKAFNEKIKDLKSDYGFYKCYDTKDENSARNALAEEKAQKRKNRS